MFSNEAINDKNILVTVNDQFKKVNNNKPWEVTGTMILGLTKIREEKGKCEPKVQESAKNLNVLDVDIHEETETNDMLVINSDVDDLKHIDSQYSLNCVKL